MAGTTAGTTGMEALEDLSATGAAVVPDGTVASSRAQQHLTVAAAARGDWWQRV